MKVSKRALLVAGAVAVVLGAVALAASAMLHGVVASGVLLVGVTLSLGGVLILLARLQ